MHPQRNPFRRAQLSKPVTLADRSGIRGDIKNSYDAARPVYKDPQVDKPGFMISHLRYVGATEGAAPAEAMTSKAHALYEYLMASARPTLKDKTEWQVSYSDARDYLDVPRSDRVAEYIDDIGQTFVSYDYTDRDGNKCYGRVQLLQCDTVQKPTGDRFIRFSMPPAVRALMLASTQYTWLELAPLPHFRCRYTARLYPIFALRAGMDADFSDPLGFSPEELAERIGWPKTGSDFHFGHFESRVLKPAMADIAAYVKAFEVSYDVRRSNARGRPVTAVLFYVSRRTKTIDEAALAPMTPADRASIRRHAKSKGVAHGELPSETQLRKAATLLKAPVAEVANAFVNAVAANDDVAERVAEHGATEAFVQDVRFRTEPDFRYPEEKPEVSFEDAAIIRVELDDGLGSEYVNKYIVKELQTNPLFTNPDLAPLRHLRLDWYENGTPCRREFTIPLVQQSLNTLRIRFRDDIAKVEFLTD